MSNQGNHPAFPCDAQPDRDGVPPEHDYIQNGPYSGKFPGMTLRDYFAGQALVGLLAQNHRYPEAAAYRSADDMLAERGRKS